MSAQQPSSQSSAAWYRIVPKRKAADVYARRFETCEEAERALGQMKRRHTHKVVPYNAHGKRLARPR